MTIDWNDLGFSYTATKSHVRYVWRDGKWDDGTLHADPHFSVHVAATALHYGQAAFEGLKVFSQKDGSISVFRIRENAKRLATSARRVMMAEVPEELFEEAVLRVVRDNREFIPPYGTGGALYVRPLLIGTGPRLGVQPADEYTLIVLVAPVGDYYKGGLTPVGALVMDDYDRAAPHGTGNVKLSGNYAPTLLPGKNAKERGFPITLYLDAVEHKYVDEFGTSNFIAIDADGNYVTPDSHSILPSITNRTLMKLAERKGIKVIRRPVEFDEISSFKEAAACGTAVVITPVNRFVHGDVEYVVGPSEGAGPIFQELYDTVRGIQTGDLPDDFGWNTPV